MQVAMEWHRHLSGMDLDGLFENEPLRRRALMLYEEEACDVLQMSDEEVIARVTGRSDIYWTSVYRREGGLLFDCDCPSDYYPCKHAGALLYNLRDHPTGSRGLLGGSRVSGASRGPGAGALGWPEDAVSRRFGATASEQREFTPGELLGVVETGSGGQEQLDFSDFFSDEAGFGETVGTVSETARFRPAFRLVRMPDPYRSMHRVLWIEPVLVYLRRDGADGRLEKFGPGKERRRGDATTERLMRMCLSVEGRRRRAVELLKLWYSRALRRGEEGFALPVDLFLERAGRIEREKEARLRRIAEVRVRWTAEGGQSAGISGKLAGGLVYRPKIELTDKEGYGEPYDARAMDYESDGEIILVSNSETGSLWYLFDSDPEGGRDGEIEPDGYVGAVASVFKLPRYLGAEEVRNFAELCRRRFPGFIEAEEVPASVRIISVVPTPVVDFDYPANPRFVGFRMSEERTSLRMSFRYGSAQERSLRSGALIPVSAAEAKELTDSAQVATETVWFIAPQEEAEEHFLELLGTALEEHGYRMQLEPWLRSFLDGYCDEEEISGKQELPQFFVESELYEIVSSVVGDLMSRGFELRIRKEKIERAPGRSTLRVASSGEDWLSIEPGFEFEEGFVPIEQVYARGLVEAGGRKFVLPPGADVEAILTALHSRRVGRRDLVALERVAEELRNPEHPALRDFFSLRERLSSFSGLEETEAPPSFTGQLRPYQKSGLSWLWFLHSYGLGGCLADDMGLGKTIQTLALLAKVREAGEMRRALVVCPVSTLGNWLREASRFTPHFRAAVHAGAGRAERAEAFERVDIVFVGYATLQRDAELMRKVEFDYLVLDEAQAIKNPKTKRRRAVASLEVPHRLALTGTPVENSVVELWSLLDVLMPGILGNRSTFSMRFGTEIEEGSFEETRNVSRDAEGGSDGAERLRRLIRPLILRRTKKAVAPELPPKEELVQYAEAGKRQVQVYESLRLHYAEEVERLIRAGERQKSNTKILEAMLRLRQAAILPVLVDREYAAVPSAKMDMLYDRLLELRDEGNKALVFSQFTGVLDEVETRMSGAGLGLYRLEGKTPLKRRERDIAGFQAAEGAAVFLISLRAGGVGINLTAADYVFLLDPWWNPAVESQAIDRAHRIGREGSVFAYRLVTTGTIEEKMLRLQERKRRISESLIRGESGALRELSNEDILGLFS